MNTQKYARYFEPILFGASNESYRSQVRRVYDVMNPPADCTFDNFYHRFKMYKSKKAKLKIKEHSNSTRNDITPRNAFSRLLNTLAPDPNPLNLPKSKESIYTPFKLPKTATDILLLSDIHIPYHNIEALTLALQYGMQHNVNTIILNGDLIDFYAISRFEKDPRKRDLAHEVNTCREFLTILRKLFPTQEIYFKCGNHDVRFEHYIMRQAPDLLGLGEYNLETLLKLEQHRITFIPDKQIIHAGQLTILHGHELGKSVFSPVNVARSLYMKAKDNAICGHHHQTSEHTEPSINGKVVTCWSVACLSELSPDYHPVGNKYTHGFAHIKVEPSGDFEVQNLRIIKGRIR